MTVHPSICPSISASTHPFHSIYFRPGTAPGARHFGMNEIRKVTVSSSCVRPRQSGMGSDEHSVSPAYVGLTQVQALVPSQVLQRLWGRTVERDQQLLHPCGVSGGDSAGKWCKCPRVFLHLLPMSSSVPWDTGLVFAWGQGGSLGPRDCGKTAHAKPRSTAGEREYVILTCEQTGTAKSRRLESEVPSALALSSRTD